ncbi:MAG: hypothetical protein ACI87W_002044 [Halieaceae bacterium]
MDIERFAAISRRDLLVGSVAAGLMMGTATNSPGSRAASSALDRVVLHRKLRFRTDAGLVFWWLRGIKYGQTDTTLTPLYSNHVGTIMRVEPRADGGMDVTSLEVTVPTQVDGDSPLREWTNPYTGETLAVTVRPVGPMKVSYSADGSRVFPAELGGARLETEAQSMAPVIVGDDAFFSELIRARVYRPGRDRPYVVNDISHYHGSLAELTDPDTVSASATVSFAEVTSWQNWMNMGAQPGTLTSRTVGAKASAYSDMPGIWRRAVAEMLPELSAQLEDDPASVLERAAAEFDR